jgi:orotate phosphoribosyltransferase
MGIQDLMQESGAVMHGHFQLTSGRHSDVYLEKFRLLERPEIVEGIGEKMAEACNGIDIEIVLGAAIGGILISSATAKMLGTKGIFAERQDGKLVLRRGFELKESHRVLIVEDIVSTGGSVRELLDIVKSHGAETAAVVCLADRTAEGIDFGCVTKALLRFPATSWEPEKCPLCNEKKPLTIRGRTGK